MEFDEKKDNNIDEIKLRKLRLRVYNLERDNYYSKKLKDNQVVDNIIRMIDNEVKNDN